MLAKTHSFAICTIPMSPFTMRLKPIIITKVSITDLAVRVHRASNPMVYQFLRRPEVLVAFFTDMVSCGISSVLFKSMIVEEISIATGTVSHYAANQHQHCDSVSVKKRCTHRSYVSGWQGYCDWKLVGWRLFWPSSYPIVHTYL